MNKISVLPDFSHVKILVVGDVMLDRYWVGNTSRISPEAPVPVVNVNDLNERPGGAANAAIGMAALGASVALAGLIGEDDAGNKLQELLRDRAVKANLVVADQQSTITKLRVMSKHQQLLRLDFEGPYPESAVAALTEAVIKDIGNYDWVVLSDYAKGALIGVDDIIAAATKKGVKVIVDPKLTDFAAYAGASIVTPNFSEFCAAAGVPESEEDLVAKARHQLAQHNIDALLITRSEDGMTLVNATDVYHTHTKAQEVFDVTGAGDTVIAALAVCLASGIAPESAAYVANIAAGVVVGKVGTSSVSRDELTLAIAKDSGRYQRIFDLELLLKQIKLAKDAGEKIVFTNGCFDLLHAGHVSYLDEARALGDRLIIAVNDDGSVRRLKGDSRPINPVDMRMQVLSGLRSVDWVVPFSEDTPLSLIEAIVPDVLVKGGDYTVDQIVGADVVQKAGGTVRSLPFLDGYSTSNIVSKILEADA